MAPGAETATYTHGHHASVLRSHTWRTARNSAAYLLPHLRPGQNVLDVGCGPGTITVDLATLVSPGRMTGLDHAEGILEQARLTAAEAGLSDRVTFVQGDVHALDFPDDTFDVVHAHQVLQHVGDPVTALREMRRVCKPGGVVAVRESDYRAFFWYPESPRLTWWQDLYDKVARGNGGEPNAGRHLWAWAREVGFSRVTPSASAWCFATDEERAWWGGLWAERVVGSDFARVAVSGGLATAPELAEAADAWRAWAADPDGSLTIPHGEILCWK